MHACEIRVRGGEARARARDCRKSTSECAELKAEIGLALALNLALALVAAPTANPGNRVRQQRRLKHGERKPRANGARAARRRRERRRRRRGCMKRMAMVRVRGCRRSGHRTALRAVQTRVRRRRQVLQCWMRRRRMMQWRAW